jgi:DNA-binding SARP family transcriptional activator
MTAEFRVLGDVELLVDGRPVPIRGARQQGILAVLLAEANRPVTGDQLLERVWGSHRRPERPANALQSQLTLLRRTLTGTDATITWQASGYRLAVPAESVDLHRFRQLLGQARAAADDQGAVALYERALGLWRGEAFSSQDTPWFTALRATLDRERHAAQLDFTDARLRCGLHTVLSAELADQAAQHPLDERIAGQLMLALYRGGRPAEALAHYQRVRERLAEELGSDPSPPLRELYQLILIGDPALASAGAAVRQAVPRQLPAAPASFTGRTQELVALTKLLDAALDPGRTVVISALAGAGGIGKTWLALHWAHQHQDRFPDGQLFIDLRGFSPEDSPVPPATAVRGFLQALGVDRASIPAEPHAQTALFRSLVADKRMLIVLDNAADTNQVTPLLPGSPTCLVLITSRNHLTGLIARHGAHHFRLDTLATAEARELLAARLGAERVAAEPDVVDELLALCGGLPLALAIATIRAHTSPDTPLRELVAELRQSATRLGALEDEDPAASLPAVLSWSQRALSDEQTTMFGLLGLAPGPDTDVPAAASLAGRSATEAGMLLRALERTSLVDRDANGRYRMHDLLRLYAAEHVTARWPDADRRAALRRVVDFYLHSAYRADRLINPHRTRVVELGAPVAGSQSLHFQTADAALGWFDTEYRCLLAVQHVAASRGWYREVWCLAWALESVNVRWGAGQDRVACWRAALDAAEHLADPALLTSAHIYLGRARASADEDTAALDHFEQALALAGRHHDIRAQAYGHYVVSLFWNAHEDHTRALEHAIRSRDLYRELPDPVWEAIALGAMGTHYARLGELERGQEASERALVLARAQGHRDNEADILNTLGYIDLRHGRFAEAIDHHGQALEIHRASGSVTNQAETLSLLGDVYAASGRPAEARDMRYQALRMFSAVGRTSRIEQLRRLLYPSDTS